MAAAAALCALAPLAGCRARVRTARAETVQGSPTLPPRPPKTNDPRPPDDDEKQPPPPPGGGARLAARKDALRSRKTAPPPAEKDQEPGEEADPYAWRTRLSTAAAGLEAGEHPDAGDQAGTPLARRPDDGTVASPGPPIRYLSPAPVRALKTARDAPREADEAPDEDEEAAAGRAGARRPGRAPATGLALDDEVPESGVGDPNAIGSYHVQIASSPEFARVLFDKVYPFMGEAELNKDLAGAPSRLSEVWIRWSLVDLLDFEHPFTRPRRVRLAPGRRD